MNKIISYNVNGIRAAINKGFAQWLEQENPDVICIQETKAQPEQIDSHLFSGLGYNCYCYSAQKKGYSGVAILSKQVPDNVVYGIKTPKYDNEGRVIRVDFGDISIFSAYFPSGTAGGIRQDYKMEWLFDFQNYLNEFRKKRPNFIVSGDFNICRLWIDIHNPEKQQKTSGFLPEEREWFQNFIDDGYIDSFRKFNNAPHNYSWWSYRAGSRAKNKGWRIDYHIITNSLEDKIHAAYILHEVKHSDHCPVVVELDF